MRYTTYLFCTALFFALFLQANAQVSPEGVPWHFTHAWAYNWTSGSWALQGRITPFYDANNGIKIAYGQVNISGTWINFTRSTFTHNGSGQVIRQLDEDSSSSGWVNKELDSFTYNPDGTFKTEIVYRPNNNKWAPTFLNNYRYDASKKIIENFEQDRNGNNWQNDDKYEYSYNNDGTLKEILDSNWYGSYFAIDHRDTFNYLKGSLHEKVHQDGNGKPGNWANVSKIVFDSVTITGIAMANWEESRMHIYPNPSTGNIQMAFPADVHSYQLSVFDMSGKMLLSMPETKMEFTIPEINIANLKPGVYLVFCKTNLGTFRTQIIRQ